MSVDNISAYLLLRVKVQKYKFAERQKFEQNKNVTKKSLSSEK